MLESESSALPFGDGPMSRDKKYSSTVTITMQVLFNFFQKILFFFFLFYLARLIFLTTLQDLSTYVDYY